MDLNQFALKNIQEINEISRKVGAERFEVFKTASFNTLRALKPGEMFQIEEEVSVANIPAFVKVACLYIMQTGWNCNIDIVGSDSNVIRGILTHTEYFSELASIRQRLDQRNTLS